MECLVKFVKRISKKDNATPAELEAMTEVARLIIRNDKMIEWFSPTS